MSRDRLNLSDSAAAEVLVVEDALYPCPKCGKGGSPAPSESCTSCGQAIPHDDMHCGSCKHRYPRASVPVMAFICRRCGEPGTSDHYVERSDNRVHDDCDATGAGLAPPLN